MKKPETLAVDMGKVMEQITLKLEITHFRWWQFRLSIAALLVMLAAKIAGFEFELQKK